MPDSFIAIDVTGIKELAKELDTLIPEVQNAIVDDVSKYLLNVLKIYPKQKYVSRKEAYGVTFFTDKQRRWFFWALAQGKLEIPYKRTQRLADGWYQLDHGFKSIIVNETEYASLVMGEGQQSRHMIKIGWKNTGEIVKERMSRILEIARGAAKRAIRRVAK